MAIDINSLTKQYANPWDTYFNYVDASGNMLGTGYDSYQDAIQKAAFQAGIKQYDPVAAVSAGYDEFTQTGSGYDIPALQGGLGFVGNFTQASGGNGGDQATPYVPENRGPLFSTELDLWNAMQSDPTMKSRLSYDVYEKYGRDLTEGQLQNMYALMSTPNAQSMLEAYGGVPDWSYHRAAYEPTYNPTAGINVSGANALVGSTPVFGDDGKITGYQINLNPEHLNLADTSGRVTSSTQGGTAFSKDMLQYITPIDANTGFVKVEDVPKIAYKSYGSSSYNKEDTLAESLGEMFTKGFIGSVAGGALGFGPLAGGANTGGSMFGDIGDWFSNLFGDGGGGLDFFGEGTDGAWADWLSGGGASAPSGWDFGPLSDSLLNGGVDPVSGMTLNQMQPGLLDAVKNYISQNPGSTLKTAVQALGGAGGLLGALGGGLLGSLNGSQQAGTTTTTQAPWGPQQPYLLDAFKRAQTAANGGALQTQANSNYQSVLNGPTTNPYLGMDNPYLQKAIDYANEDTTRAMMPAMNQANRASGSFGNSGVAETFGRELSNQYGRNATGMRMQDYTNQQNLAQQNVNNTLGFTKGVSDFSAAPSRNYAQTVQGSYGGSTTSPYFDNPLSNILGGATIGQRIGSLWG